jgi:hypothetical protein
MTFEEWYQDSYPTGQYPAGFDPRVLTVARHAWDAAMEEAARKADGFAAECIRLAEERPGGIMATMFRAQASVLRQTAMTYRGGAHPTAWEATPAPREEAPGAGSCAPGEPAPGPRQEPG